MNSLILPNSITRFLLKSILLATVASHFAIATAEQEGTAIKKKWPCVWNANITVNNKNRSKGFPALFRMSYSETDRNNIEVKDLYGNFFYRKKDTKDTKIPSLFKLTNLKKNYVISFTSNSYSTKLDDSIAEETPWPKKWDSEYSDFLRPSTYIESKRSSITKPISKLLKQNKATPHLAAKTIIKYCIDTIKSHGRFVAGSGKYANLDIQGANHAFNANEAVSETDLLCACVASLRAAEIPARPIIGISNSKRLTSQSQGTSFVVWGEYALPGIGWIPFNTTLIRESMNESSIDTPWDGLGTIEALNKCIPLTINFEMHDLATANVTFEAYSPVPTSTTLTRTNPQLFKIEIKVQPTSIWPLLIQSSTSQIPRKKVLVTDKNGDLAYSKKQTKRSALTNNQLLLDMNPEEYNLSFECTSFSSILDEDAAIDIPWADGWFEDAITYLDPSEYIESDATIFSEIVEDYLTGLSPHILAKNLIRHCITNIKSNGKYVHSFESKVTGVDMRGALYAASTDEVVSESDLICASIACLRAAGIPARPVIGITNRDLVNNQIDATYIIWGEYALPNTGWVPFNTKEIRNHSRTEDTKTAWRGLGTITQLSHVVPLAFNFQLFDIETATQTLNLESILPESTILKRSKPKIYNVEVYIDTSDGNLGWPALLKTQWSDVDRNSFRVTDDYDVHIYKREYSEYEIGISNQLHLTKTPSSYRISFYGTSYSSELDDKAALNIPWPITWFDEAEPFLKPSTYIDTNNPLITKLVAETIDKETMTPHIAAKKLIRECLHRIQSTGNYSLSKGEYLTSIRKTSKKCESSNKNSRPINPNDTFCIDVLGSNYAFTSSESVSECDLVCACVAVLRSAGIPARPILGMTIRNMINGSNRIAPSYAVWGEYALPNVGWVPFNPRRMRGTVDNLTLEEAWQGLGTMPYLNTRVPMSANFKLYDMNQSEQQLRMKLVSSPGE